MKRRSSGPSTATRSTSTSTAARRASNTGPIQSSAATDRSSIGDNVPASASAERTTARPSGTVTPEELPVALEIGPLVDGAGVGSALPDQALEDGRSRAPSPERRLRARQPTRSPSMTAAWARRGATQSPTRSTTTPGVEELAVEPLHRVRRAPRTPPSPGRRSAICPVGWCWSDSTPPSRPIGTSSVDCTMPLASARIHQFSMSSVMPRSWPTTIPGVITSTSHPRSASSSATDVAWWKPISSMTTTTPSATTDPSSTSRTSQTFAPVAGPPRTSRLRAGGHHDHVGSTSLDLGPVDADAVSRSRRRADGTPTPGCGRCRRARPGSARSRRAAPGRRPAARARTP